MYKPIVSFAAGLLAAGAGLSSAVAGDVSHAGGTAILDPSSRIGAFLERSHACWRGT